MKEATAVAAPSQLNNTSEAFPRNPALDFVRSVAILCVVLNHSVESIYNMAIDSINSLSIQSRIFAISSFTLGRLGVPLFFFLSGCLLLSRAYDSNSCISFWRKKLLPLIFTWEIWIIIYYTFQVFVINRTFNIRELVEMMLLVKPVGMSNEWYMPVIIGIYIFIPLISVVVQKINLKCLIFPLSISYFIFFVLNAVRRLSASDIDSSVDLSFGGGAYGFYVVLGYLYYYYIRKENSFKKHLAATAAIFASFIAIQLVECRLGIWSAIWYTSPLVPLISFFLFSALLNFVPICNWRIWKKVSLFSFGIFLVHRPVQILILQLFKFKIILPLQVIILFLLSFFISLGITWLISKLPPKISKALALLK